MPTPPAPVATGHQPNPDVAASAVVELHPALAELADRAAWWWAGGTLIGHLVDERSGTLLYIDDAEHVAIANLDASGELREHLGGQSLTSVLHRLAEQAGQVSAS